MTFKQSFYFLSGTLFSMVAFLKLSILAGFSPFVAIPSSFILGATFAFGVIPLLKQFYRFFNYQIIGRHEEVKKNHDINERLMTACRNGDLLSVQKEFLNGARADYCDDAGNTPLHAACNPNIRDLDPDSANQLAVPYLAIIASLLENGADPFAKNHNGFIPLHIAARMSFYPLFKSFKSFKDVIPTQEGTSIFDYRSNSSETPLGYVLTGTGKMNQKYLCVKELLEHGANPNLEITFHDAQITSGHEETYITTPLGALIKKFIDPYKNQFFIENRNTKAFFKIIDLMRQYNANPLAQFTSSASSYYSYTATYSVKRTILDMLDGSDYHFPATSIKEKFKEKLNDALIKSYDLNEFAKATTNEGIQYTVNLALCFQKNGVQSLGCVNLADRYFNQMPQNQEGLQSLLQALQVTDQGYAYIHLLFAQGYLASIKTPTNEVVDNEAECDQYRLLFVKHCLMGLATQERDSEHKTATLQSLSMLLQTLAREWALKGWHYSENIITNVFDFMAEALLRNVYFMRDETLSSQPSNEIQAQSAPTVLVAFSQRNTGQEGTMGKGKEKARAQDQKSDTQGEAENSSFLRQSAG